MGARFLRIGIAGFKSFADAATLEVLPGLTGIVGPNGCGKSNVAEALRWAMGEFNARHLRGGEMDDVIFAGTASRPGRNLAEVSLTLEGDAAGLPPPFAGQAELQVTRRLERGGGSSYRVNGREVRARDVLTLFADLGSGARASAMVSQNRVGALVAARPEERRAVLEEAAGIGGLHGRRAEAEARLRATEANLDRAEERRALLDGQLAGLRVQALQAGRYRTVTDAIQDAEGTLLAIGRARADRADAEARSALEAADAAVRRAVLASAAAAAEARARQAALPALREAEAAARAAQERARLVGEALAAEVARARTELAAAEQRGARLRQDRVHAASVLADAEGADARLVAEAERLRAEAAEHPARLRAARTHAVAAAQALKAADAEAASAAQAAADAQARGGALRQVLDAAQARDGRARDGVARLQDEQRRAEARLVDPARVEAADAARDAAVRHLVEAVQARDEADAARSGAARSAAAARNADGRLDAARLRLAAEVAALSEVLGVRDTEGWPPLLDQVSVPAGLEAALGAVLGEELGAAADPGAARHWRTLPPGPGTGSGLAEAIAHPPALARALSGVRLVDSDAAGDAAQPGLRPGETLVSAAGAVWRWDGYTVRAGTPTAAAVRLRQRNRLAGLRGELAVAADQAASARALRTSADAAERRAVAAEGTARAAHRTADAGADQARATAQALRTEADAAAARAAAVADGLAPLLPEREAAAAALAAARAAVAGQPDPAGLRRAADAARAAVTAARTAEAAAQRQMDAVDRAEHARQARLRFIERERDDRRMRAADLGGRVKDLVARVAEAEAEHARLLAAPGQAARREQDARTAMLDADEARRTAAAALAEGETRAGSAAAALRAAEGAGYAAREGRVRAEGARTAADALRAASESRIAERSGALPPLPAVAESSAAAEDRVRARLGRLVRERDGIGPVNLRAAAEAAVLEAEVGGIIREKDELATAVSKLRGSIGHLNREGRERLSAVFHAVDNHFQALFGRMFGGGRAHLALVGSEDPLLAGLEIYAQPPGKKLASLALLSGGEQALTALSLVFAVFRCNPAPLCVLDEVDAPLDDSNVDRFCGLLADVVRDTGTRFLVVTHHQLTMARMDRLYGVTMQERGVSRLVSVDLGGAAAMAEGGPVPVRAAE